jgi:hypothetical protein
MNEKEVAALEAAVWRRASGQVRCLCVHIEGDGVVLRGRARTYHAKQLAQHAIMEASRLPIRANEIEVD